MRFLLLRRVKNYKEDAHRYQEKLGYYNQARPKGKLIWFHAASIGEFNAVLPIIRSLANDHPQINILVTTVTTTAAHIAKKNLPSNAIHQFAPLDCYNIVKRFMKHWKPSLTIWTESEFWPNMISLAADRAHILLINARLSQKSFRKWQYATSLARFILKRFSLILTQNKESKLFIELLGINKVIESGNLKFIAENFTFNEKEVNQFKTELENRTVLMAASTHPGEEEIFIKIQQDLKKTNLITILAPRHPNRSAEVIATLKASSLNFITRSSKEKISNDTQVILVDTLGEFGLFYRLSEIVCIGGSWHKIGHNFIEAAKLRNLIIFGSNMQNSREVSNLFLKQKASINANNAQDIEEIIKNYIDNPNDFIDYKNNAENIVDEMNKVKETVLNYIKPYIP
jgi:3-deoxy-D-manno-octulosonic-acid transferase